SPSLTLLFSLFPQPPTPTLFPYTTLFRFMPPRVRAAPAASPASDKRREESAIAAASVSAAPPSVRPMTSADSVPPRRNSCPASRSEEHTSELQSRENLVCRLLLEKKNRQT